MAAKPTIQLDTPGLDGEDWPKRTNDKFPLYVLLGLPKPEGYVPRDGEIDVDPFGADAQKPAPVKKRPPARMGKRWQ